MNSQITDFGNIYSKTPSKIFCPKTIQELSEILHGLNEQNTPVTIRNTGHSVNGQTLTSGVQIMLGDMQWSHFDENLSEVTIGAGVSWDALFKKIRFPEYCIPVYPDNPGQEIHVTGTLAVGGIGNYSASGGGLWNHVKRITLVTMEGNVFHCSRTEHSDLFKYSLGGFGRIGVIAEVTLGVVKSPKEILPVTMIAKGQHDLAKRISNLAHDTEFKGITFGLGRGMIRGIKAISFPAFAILGLVENDNPEKFFEEIKMKYGRNVLSRHPFIRKNSKRTILKYLAVYQTPESFISQNQGDGLCHPWSDYIIPIESLENFNRRLCKLLRKYRLNKYGICEPIVDTPFRVRFETIGFLARNISQQSGFHFPLSLDITGQDIAVGVGCWLAVPEDQLSNAKIFIKDLTEYCYSLGGKRYLYGWHDLTKAQLKLQFGVEAIRAWNDLKRKTDPKRLLNRDVIEHLDYMD